MNGKEEAIANIEASVEMFERALSTLAGSAKYVVDHGGSGYATQYLRALKDLSEKISSLHNLKEFIKTDEGKDY